MERINFSHNWNNKLGCAAFTTIRPAGKKYSIGTVYEAWFKDQFVARVQIVDIKEFRLGQLNEFIARLDTGYDAGTCKGIMQKMYPEADTMRFYLILLTKQIVL